MKHPRLFNSLPRHVKRAAHRVVSARYYGSGPRLDKGGTYDVETLRDRELLFAMECNIEIVRAVSCLMQWVNE